MHEQHGPLCDQTAARHATPLAVAIHVKPFIEALGARRGLELVREAGVDSIVLWAGEDGRFLDALPVARDLSLSVWAVALPKLRALAVGAEDELPTWLRRAEGARAERVSLIFGDTIDLPVSTVQWRRLLQILNGSPLSLCIENNGRPAERFSTPNELLRLLDSAPRLSCAVDLGHLASSGQLQTPVNLRAIEPLLLRQAWVEVHDNDARVDQHLPLGQGEGSGRSLDVLQRFQTAPRKLVIETDARQGSDEAGWLRAIRSDLRRVRAWNDALEVS